MKFIKKHIFLVTTIIVTLIIILLGGLKYYLYQKKDNNIEPIIEEEASLVKEEKVEEPKKVSIDIKGAVKKPGVYEIEEGKLVIDTINLAGGLTENANTSLINLAKKVSNEMVIIIYTNDEVKKAMENSTVSTNNIAKIIDKECVCPNIKNDACINTQTKKEANNTTKKTDESNNKTSTEDIIININSATKEELENIPGIGSSKAEAIISYREENGPFNNIEDIKNVTGIGDSLYEKIKTYITV